MEQTPADKYIQRTTRALEEFETLPHSHAFEALIENHLVERKTVYKSGTDEPFYLGNDIVTKSLRDTFFFPHNSKIDSIRLELLFRDQDAWTLSGSLDINTQKYQLVAMPEDCTLTGEDVDGNRIASTTSHAHILSLLAQIAASDREPGSFDHIIAKFEYLNDPSSIAEAYEKLLKHLGNINGKVTTLRTAELPHDHPDRSLVVSLNEVESKTLSGVNVRFMLDWELADAKYTETTTMLGKLNQHEKQYDFLATEIRVLQRSGTSVLPSDFLVSKQIPELYSLGESTFAPIVIDPRDNYEAWVNTAMTLMATIGPLLQEFCHLDASE